MHRSPIVCLTGELQMVWTYQPGESLRLAHPLHQHHHFFFVGGESRKLLADQGLDSLEKLDVVSEITDGVTFTACSSV